MHNLKVNYENFISLVQRFVLIDSISNEWNEDFFLL